MQLVVEALRVGVALGFENRDGVIGVLAFVRGDGAEDLAEASGRDRRPSRGAGERERLEHDLLNAQAADVVALGDAGHEAFAESLPMFSVDVADDVDSELTAGGDECRGMTALDGCMI